MCPSHELTRRKPQLNLDILSSIIPLLASHELTLVLRTCKTIHNLALPHLYSIISPERQRRLLVGEEAWQNFYSTMQLCLEPCHNRRQRTYRHPDAKYIRSLTVNMHTGAPWSWQGFDLTHPLVTFLPRAINLVSLHLTKTCEGLPRVIDVINSSFPLLKYLSVLEINLRQVPNSIWQHLSRPLSYLHISIGESRGNINTFPYERALKLQDLAKLCESLEEARFGFSDHRFAHVFFQSTTVTFPRVHRIHFDEGFPYLISDISRAFPNLTTIIHERNTSAISNWEWICKHPLHFAQRMAQPCMWSLLDQVVIWSHDLYTKTITCPIRDLTVFLHVTGSHSDSEHAEQFMKCMKNARPVVLTLEICWQGNDMKAHIAQIIHSAASELRCLRLVFTFADIRDMFITGIDLSVSCMLTRPNQATYLILKEMLINILSLTSIVHLSLGHQTLILDNKDTGSLDYLHHWSLDETAAYVATLAKAILTLQSVTVINKTRALHAWHIQRDVGSGRVEVVSLTKDWETRQCEAQSLLIQRQ
jgi:hypothetical protein